MARPKLSGCGMYSYRALEEVARLMLKDVGWL
jgi:hypothetical protein